MIIKAKKINISLLILSLIFTGLDAYTFQEIPFSWIGYALSVILLLVIGLDKFKKFLYSKFIITYWIAYAILITLIQYFRYSGEVPDLKYSSFDRYILLRLLVIIFFLFTLSNLYNISNHFSFEIFSKIIIYSSLFISIMSLISYFSYVFEYSDFYRNRIGTNSNSVQKVLDACTILRNYGTFREPSFLAVWLSPTVPFYFFKFRESPKLQYLVLFPILSIVLSRSLTGIFGFILAMFFTFIFFAFKNSRNYYLLFPIILILVFSTFGNSLTYKFPALDAAQCPPNSADKCDCSIYDDEEDLAKNSVNLNQSIFNRAKIVVTGGVANFENISRINSYLSEKKVTLLGDGFGIANVKFTNDFNKNNKIIRNNEVQNIYPGLIVSMNNLYANIYFSTGIFGLILFFVSLIQISVSILKQSISRSPILFASFLNILIMYFFQGEELSLFFAYIIGMGLSHKENS